MNDAFLMSTKHVARTLNLSLDQVRRLARRQVIPAHKTGAGMGKTNGRDWLFDSRDVYKYKASQQPDLPYPVAPEVIVCNTADNRLHIPEERHALAFNSTDSEPLFPFGTYTVHEIEDGYWEAVLWMIGNDTAAFRAIVGDRAQAIEACRSDARLRIAAARSLEVAA